MAEISQKRRGKNSTEVYSQESSTFKFDIFFQRLILKQSIESEDYYQQFRNLLESEYFDYIELTNIYEHVENFYNKNEIIPSYNVLSGIISRSGSHIKDAILKELDEIKNLKYKNSDVVHTNEMVVPFCKRKILYSAFIESSGHIDNNNFEEANKIIDNAVSRSVVYSKSDDSFYFENEEDRYDEKYNQKISMANKIPTLFKTIDDRLRGGISKKELGILVAPPYRGKSAGLIQLGTNALFTGKNVYHVTVEMSKIKTEIRYDTCLTGMDYDSIVNNKKMFLKKREEFHKLYRGGLKIEEFPARSVSVSDIKNRIKLLRKRFNFNPDVLILDYVDELKRPNNNQPVTYAVGDVVSSLRGMGSELDIATWTASQTNKGTLSKVKFDMDDIADSWDKAKIADIIIALCQTEDEEAKNRMRWYILKNRNNKRYQRKIDMETKLEIMRFKEI